MYISCSLPSVRLDSDVMSVLHRSYQITHNRVTPTTAATLRRHTPVSKVINLLYLLVKPQNDFCLKLLFLCFLANVNSSSCSLYVVVRPSVCRLSSVVCRLSSVCNVRAPYSGD